MITTELLLHGNMIENDLTTKSAANKGDDDKRSHANLTERPEDSVSYYIPYGQNKVQKSQPEPQQEMQQLGNSDRNLWQMAAEGDVAGLRSLLGNNSNVDPKDDEDRTPLIYAALEGRDDALKFLLDSGAELNAKDLCGLTPLMAAASGGHLTTVKLLLERGANVSERTTLTTPHEATALDIARRQGHAHVVKLLKEFGAQD